MCPERCARLIVRAIEARKRRYYVAFGFKGWFGLILKKAAPRLFDFIVSRHPLDLYHAGNHGSLQARPERPGSPSADSRRAPDAPLSSQVREIGSVHESVPIHDSTQCRPMLRAVVFDAVERKFQSRDRIAESFVDGSSVIGVPTSLY